jgi:hypothetical protein
MADEHYLKQAIENNHLKKSEVAAALHISPGRLTQILDGTTRMSKEHETQLLEFLLSYFNERVKRKGSDALNYDEKLKLLHLLFDGLKDSGVYITQQGKKNYKMEFRGKLFDKQNIMLPKYEVLV